MLGRMLFLFFITNTPSLFPFSIVVLSSWPRETDQAPWAWSGGGGSFKLNPVGVGSMKEDTGRKMSMASLGQEGRFGKWDLMVSWISWGNMELKDKICALTNTLLVTSCKGSKQSSGGGEVLFGHINGSSRYVIRLEWGPARPCSFQHFYSWLGWGRREFIHAITFCGVANTLEDRNKTEDKFPSEQNRMKMTKGKI